MPSRISISPDPPIAGQTAEVCYDFDGLSITSVNLEILWTPSTLGSENFAVTATENCYEIQVPGTAEAFLIKDLTGPSEDLGGAVDE